MVPSGFATGRSRTPLAPRDNEPISSPRSARPCLDSSARPHQDDGAMTGTTPLTDATRSAIELEVAKYPQKKTALLPSLKLAQKEKGWLARETLAEVADLCGLPHSHAVELA